MCFVTLLFSILCVFLILTAHFLLQGSHVILSCVLEQPRRERGREKRRKGEREIEVERQKRFSGSLMLLNSSVAKLLK